jgi:hypothetical protein
MVRWIDGFYGGLIAGTISALFFALVAAVWLHDGAGDPFAQTAQALPPFHGAPPSWPLVGLGAVLWLLLAAAFGMLYATLARHVRSMWRAPGSVAWGLSYGLLVWWAINAVVVPVSGAVTTQPAWERLVGTVICYGLVLSEVTTLARRRAEAARSRTA